ncbi:MAG TPA: SMP-30/gluconolactonase/LRE family protein, partial [Schlesneria sp.]
MRRFTCSLATLAVIAVASVSFAEDLAHLITPGAEVKKVTGDCKFTEGPAFSPKGFLLFSDIPNSRIVRVDADGTVSDFLKPSGATNGLMFDAAGNLYACQGGARRVVKIGTQDGKIEPLCELFDGKQLNSPNDLALDGHGGLYFTDPRYGQDMKIDQTCMGVYYVDAAGKTTRVIDNRERPNGVLVSNDHKSLLVAEPNKRELWSYPIGTAGQVGSGKLIYTGDSQLDGGGPDGMGLDANGNIYATYKSVVVLKADGTLIGRIPVPEQPANCKFGGTDGKTLYITARTSVYSLSMTIAGAPPAAAGPRPAPQLSQRDGSFRGVARLSQGDKAPAGSAEVKIDDITLKVPATWKQQPPANKLRLAQFLIPPAEGDEHPTELVISSFPGGGGGVDANLKRWTDQFSPEERKVKIFSGKSPQGEYVLHDVSGTYNFSAGGPFAGGK